MQQLSNPLTFAGEDIRNVTERACVFMAPKSTLKILEEMFTVYAGGKIRKNVPFLTALHTTLSTIEYPTFDDVWTQAGREYTENTKKQNRSWIKKSGWLDGETFGVRFWNEYQRRWTAHTERKERMTALKAEASLRHSYDVEEGYDYENTMDVIRANPLIIYRLPELPVKSLFYFDTHNIQIIKMNHVGGNAVVQLPLSYHYRCGGCGNEHDFPYDVTKVACPNEECGRWMTRVKSQDTIRPAFASRVITDDLNSISIISLSEIPQGEFIGAVFLCRNKADYYLFMIATEEIEPTSSTVSIVQGRHAIWQLIDMIDAQHEERIEKHIHGMDWYKASILLAYLANCKGRVSTNCLIVGDPGVGKTSTPRFYMATLTPQQKVIDAMQLTGPGLHGSMAQIKIGDSTVNVPEAGLLVRHRLVVIDELLENRNSLMPQLKSALMSSTISREVAGNRTQTPKYATAIATSNPVPAVIMEQIEWMDTWLKADGGVETSIFSEHPAMDAMIEEWRLRGLEWRTGQTLADIDRYPFLFFVRDPSDEISDYDLGGEDNEIDDLKLAKLLYNSDINEYFSFCGRLKVDWKPHNTRIIDLVREIREHDKIHSKKRLGQNITLMLQLSAQINGRCDLTDEDFDFVKELWSKTCEWIDVSELSHNSNDKTYPEQEWTIEKIDKAIRDRMKEFEGSSKFWYTPRGFSMVAAQLEDVGAPSGLIEGAIKRFREGHISKVDVQPLQNRITIIGCE